MTIDQSSYEEIVREWPEEPSEIAETTVDSYGLPDEAVESRLIWHDCDPWKRTELFRDGVPHEFPKEHTDYIEQFIDYHVPPEKADELTQFDGSVMIERTKGELSARCDKEAMNFLAINLAHDIVLDRKSVDEARQEYATTALEAMMGGSPEYTQGFQFALPTGDQRDPDETIVTDAMKAEVEEMLGGAVEAEEE